MSKVRVEVEWIFADAVNYFKFFRFPEESFNLLILNYRFKRCWEDVSISRYNT